MRRLPTSRPGYALIEADGPDAIGGHYGNPASFSSFEHIVFMNRGMDAVGTQNRYSVGSIDQNAVHVVARAMYGADFFAPASDIDECDFSQPVGTNAAVSAWNWLEIGAAPPEAHGINRNLLATGHPWIRSLRPRR
jgi:hypothetical protein